MKVALLFPGYGSQRVGMGKELYDEYRIVQEYFEEASNCVNINFVKLCFASSDIELGKMTNAYTSLFLLGSAVAAVLKEEGIEPSIVAGYDNGEYAALFAAGCFSLPDGLYLANKFCSFYQEAIDTMDVVAIRILGLSTTQLERLCNDTADTEGKASIALYNSRIDHIVTGDSDRVERVRDHVQNDEGVAIEDCSIEVGLHSELMIDVADQFKKCCEKVDFKDLRIPFIDGIDGTRLVQGQQVKDFFIRQVRFPFMMNSVLRELADYDIILIAGPGTQLIAMVKSEYPEKVVMTIEKRADIEELTSLIKNKTVD